MVKGLCCCCSNCGDRIKAGAGYGEMARLYSIGCRAVGDAFYCGKCVRTWKDRNGEEFDIRYKAPKDMFVEWWIRRLTES